MDRYLDQGTPPTPTRKHLDGSPCYEGVQRCPSTGGPCCETFEDHTVACVYDIRYEWWEDKGFWVIPIPFLAGGGGIKISYCPHCGTDLTTTT